MAFDINGFQQELLSGTRPNLFEVEISGVETESSFLVTAASLPGRTIGTASAFYRGREIKLAGDMVFAPWTTTIINDSEMRMRDYIEKWMNDFIEHSATKSPTEGRADPADYFGTLKVKQLDKTGESIREYILVGAWPSDISEIGLSFDSNDQISSFTCTWQYQYLVAVNAAGEEVGSGDGEEFGAVPGL